MTNAGAGDLDQNLFALFARQAARRPDAKAVIDDTGATTYGALLTRACVIADALTQRGLGTEQPVGVLMKRTSDLLATLLGILGAGGCYVPLDPEDPTGRTRRMIDGAKCRLVLGHRLLLEEFRSRLHDAGDPADTVELVDVEQYAATTTFAVSPRRRIAARASRTRARRAGIGSPMSCLPPGARGCPKASRSSIATS